MAAAAGAVERAVARLCSEHADERTLRTALVGELRRTVGFDWYVWLLTDPETEVGSAPLAETPHLQDLPRLIRAKYLTALNRWTTLDPPVATLHTASGGAPEQSLLWRDVLAGYGVVDVASLVLRDGYGCWGWLDLWRTAGSGPFGAGEQELLSSVVSSTTEGVRRALARTFDDAPASTMERSGPVVLVLSPGLEVRAQTPDTEAYLRALLPPEGDRRPVPAAAYNVAAQLLSSEAGVDDHPATARVHLRGGVWLTLRAARVERTSTSTDRDIAVTVEPASPAERRSVFVRAHALSPREVELVDHLARGSDTRTIARALFVSEHTVQDHLKSIFAKTGVRNRRTLLARLSGR